MRTIKTSMFNILKPLFLSGAVFFMLSSCTELIDIKLDDSEVRLVIEGEITNEPARHAVKITRSANYFSNEPAPRVTGAIVSITDSENSHILIEEEPGLYLTEPDVFGTPGKTYQLTVLTGGMEYTATTEMKQVMPIDSIQFRRSVQDEKKYEILLYAQEPTAPGDHYMWKSYKNDSLLTDSISKVIFLSDDLINGRYLNGLIVQQIEAIPGDEITLEMLAVPQEYYQFVLTLMIESRWRGGPFDGPPANIQGNISNNALGFFVAYSKTSDTRKIPE
jgi:hypothetical protein